MKNIERVPSARWITLSDLSEGMAREARRNLRAGARRFSFAVSDAQSVPFYDESFGAVIANHMLYDVPGRQRAFAEIRRVLKPGGELYATTSGFGRLRETQDLVGRVKPEASIGPNEPDDTPFRLETGEEQLASWFEDIQVRRLERELIVTEVEPLVRYVQSAARTRLDTHQ